jgi:outer membrane lipoprotein-sorting protein
MKYLNSLIILIFLHTSNCICQTMKPASEAQKRKIINQITQSAKITNTLECTFVQKKSISVLSETVVSEGIMYFKKPNNVRWQYNKPYPFIFILSDNNVYIKNDKRTDHFNTNSNKIFKEISAIMIGGINGDLLLNNKQFSSLYFSNNENAEVQLTPKDKALRQIFKHINLTFSKATWLVKSIEMVEDGGDNTIINFTEKHVNKKISDDIFKIN